MSPAELLMGRQIHLDLVHPNLADQVDIKQETQEMYHERHAKDHTFNEGDPMASVLYYYAYCLHCQFSLVVYFIVLSYYNYVNRAFVHRILLSTI